MGTSSLKENETLIVVPSGTRVAIDGIQVGLLEDTFVYTSKSNIAVIKKLCRQLKNTGD
jgi:hypothetical protein